MRAFYAVSCRTDSPGNRERLTLSAADSCQPHVPTPVSRTGDRARRCRLATVALGLLAYQLAGADAGTVLGTAFAIKMVAYVGCGAGRNCAG